MPNEIAPVADAARPRGCRESQAGPRSQSRSTVRSCKGRSRLQFRTAHCRRELAGVLVAAKAGTPAASRLAKHASHHSARRCAPHVRVAGGGRVRHGHWLSADRIGQSTSASRTCWGSGYWSRRCRGAPDIGSVRTRRKGRFVLPLMFVRTEGTCLPVNRVTACATSDRCFLRLGRSRRRRAFRASRRRSPSSPSCGLR